MYKSIFGDPFLVNDLLVPDLDVSQVIFNPPATIVHWNDGTKTVAMCSKEDVFNEEFGFAMACAKKLLRPYEKFQAHIENAYRPYLKSHKKPKSPGDKVTCRGYNVNTTHTLEINDIQDLFDFVKTHGGSINLSVM